MKTELKKLVADKLLAVLSEEGINGKERMKVLSCTYNICRRERIAEEKNESKSEPVA